MAHFVLAAALARLGRLAEARSEADAGLAITPTFNIARMRAGATDRGNRMSATHASKRGRRWRYYVSQAILQGHKHEAGSVARVPALEIERRVAEAARAAGADFVGFPA